MILLLGLDSSAYQHVRRTDAANDEDDEIAMGDIDKYKSCKKQVPLNLRTLEIGITIFYNFTYFLLFFLIVLDSIA